MFDEAADEALHRPHKHSVQHHRSAALVVRVDVLDVEALREIEVELHGGSLPRPPDRIDQLEVQLGSVKGAASLIHPVYDAPPLEHVLRTEIASFHSPGVPSAFSGRVARTTV